MTQEDFCCKNWKRIRATARKCILPSQIPAWQKKFACLYLYLIDCPQSWGNLFWTDCEANY